MKKWVINIFILANFQTVGFAFQVDYGFGKSVQLDEELSASQTRTYKVNWADVIEPKLVISSGNASLEFEEKSCKQKQKYFAYKIEGGTSPKQLQDENGYSTSDLALTFALSDFYLKSDLFRFNLDKMGIGMEQVLKNDLFLDVKDVEIIYSEGSMGDLLGAENAEKYLKEKISSAAFALEEHGKMVIKSNHLAFNCALLNDQVESINFSVVVRQNPKITWIKKVSEQKVLGVSVRAQIEAAMPVNTNLLIPNKVGPVVNMMNYMLSLSKNNEEELLSNKDLSYRLFTHLTNSDSSSFLKLDHEKALLIALKLSDKKESRVESQLAKNIQLIKE